MTGLSSRCGGREGERDQFTGPGGAAAAQSRKVSPRRGSENGSSESARADTSEGTGCGKAMLVFGSLEATLFCKRLQREWASRK